MTTSASLRTLAIALFALGIAAAAAQPAATARPKVGLVLGGGGARGSAHIGVLEVLEENRVPVDCIAGTSMGALVGGAYASGVAPAEMKDAIRRADWTAMFEDSAGRENMDLRRKLIDDRFFSALEFGVERQGLTYREGAVAGERIKLFFNQLVREDLGERTIEELALPLSLIATDIGTGERVAMRSGNLTSAMRASMSIPGAIAPVVRYGRKLVDGGLVDNVPISEALDGCKADVVIAVNVGSPLLKPEEVSGVVSVVGQMVNLLTEQNVAKSLALLRPGDIYLRPELGDFSVVDYGRQMEGAEAGRMAALAQRERLRSLSVSGPEYRVWRASVRLPTPVGPPVVDEVQVGQTRFVNPESIRAGIRQADGQPFDTARLTEDLVRIYGQGDLRNLDYALVRERERTILRIAPIEKPWGPDYLRFGLNFSSDFASEASYNVRALYRRTWLNAYAGEWLSTLQIGSEQRFYTEFYQPLDLRSRWFLRPFASADRGTAGLYFEGERVADYRLLGSRMGFDVGLNLGVSGMARIGWMGRRLDASLETGSPLLPDVTERVGGPNAALVIDTYDQEFFPMRGFKVDVGYFDAQRVTQGTGKYGRIEAKAGGATTLGDFVFLGALEGGKATRGSLPLGDAFSLGGPRHLSGFATGQILGDDYSYGRIEAQYRLTKPMPLLGLSLLAGALYETGRMKKPVTEPGLTGWLQSFGAYLATNTAFGPMYFGYAYAPEGKGRVYLFIGTP